LFDDEFYVLNRRWFDKWKSFTQYDYIAKLIIEDKKQIKDISVNKIINSGGTHPGDVTNRFLLMESKDYYHNRNDDKEYTNFPLKEDSIIGRDYVNVSRGVWKLFKRNYDGLEILRYSIQKDKIGKLFRDAMLPKIKIAILRRQDKLKYPKSVSLARKMTFYEVKSYLKNIFQFLGDTSH